MGHFDLIVLPSVPVAAPASAPLPLANWLPCVYNGDKHGRKNLLLLRIWGLYCKHNHEAIVTITSTKGFQSILVPTWLLFL
jgi:hypothetical protein